MRAAYEFFRSWGTDPMLIDDLSSNIQYLMDLLGIFAFALSGAFTAVRRDFDLFGAFTLSWAAGLGGGLFRDLVLGVTPVAFTDLGYFFAPVVAAAIVYFGHRLYDDHRVRTSTLLDISDAAALGIFSVTGTVKALEHGFNIPAAAVLGSTSAVGGGVLASILALEVPSLLRWDRDLYALPALAGAGLTGALHIAGLLNVGTGVGTAGFALLLRLLALRYRWRTPRSHFWRNPFSGMRHQPAAASPQHEVAPETVATRYADTHTVHIRTGRRPSTSGRRVPDPRVVQRASVQESPTVRWRHPGDSGEWKQQPSVDGS
jgi:uncharacterized membrane protein YeiH